jgi:hypothetical protein
LLDGAAGLATVLARGAVLRVGVTLDPGTVLALGAADTVTDARGVGEGRGLRAPPCPKTAA